MRVRAAIAIVIATLAAASVAAQNRLLPTPPEEIETILELLDAVEAAEARIVGSDEPLPELQRAELAALTDVADAIGAEDLAARARSLLVLARPARPGIDPELDPVALLGPPLDRTLVRGSRRYEAMTGILGATGFTALSLSAAFYALAERDFRQWTQASDAETGDLLFQSWRGFELMSLSLGGAALLSLGVGMPLLYAGSVPPESLSTPLSRELFTESERAARLAELYAKRTALSLELEELAPRERRRRIASTAGTATGVVATIVSVAMFYVAEERYQAYLEAPFSEEAEQLRDQVRLFDTIAISSAGLATAGYATSVGVEVLSRDRSEVEDELRGVNREIIAVRSAPTIDVPADEATVESSVPASD